MHEIRQMEIDTGSGASVLEDAREIDEVRSRFRLRRSRLDRFKAEIVELVAAKVSYDGIALWLRNFRRCKVSRSAIQARVKHWQSSPSAEPIDELPPRKPDKRGKLIRQATRGLRAQRAATEKRTPEAEQAHRLFRKFIAFGEQKSPQIMGDGYKIFGVRTFETYVAALAAALKQLHKFAPFKSARDVSVDDWVKWLNRRSQAVTSAVYRRDLHVVKLLLVSTRRASLIEWLPIEFPEASRGRLANEPRYYSAAQWRAIAAHQTPLHAFTTFLIGRTGMRAQGPLTLREPGIRAPSISRNWRSDRFIGLSDFERWTVKEKNGLIREIAVPADLAKMLRQLRLQRPVIVTDRGVNFETHFPVSGGRKWSESFSSASVRALGWSLGGHGLRHSYAESRIETLQSCGKAFDTAREIVSQELGHFRASVTNSYLRGSHRQRKKRKAKT